MLWVDIIPQADLLKYPKVDIMGPEKMKFELRVVCWRSQNIKVHGQKSLDLFARFYMEGDEKHKQDTDTHWFCKTGSGSWNWRIKIALELPIKARELGKLKIQMWERNVITSNTIVGESFVSLYDWFMLAYRRQTSGVSPFKELKDAEKKLGALGGFSMEEGEDTTVDDLLADMPSDPRAEADDERHNDGEDYHNDDDDDDGDLEKGTKTSVAVSARNEAALDDDTAPLLGNKSTKDGKTSSSSAAPTAAEAAATAKQDQEDEDEESDEVIKMVNVSTSPLLCCMCIAAHSNLGCQILLTVVSGTRRRHCGRCRLADSHVPRQGRQQGPGQGETGSLHPDPADERGGDAARGLWPQRTQRQPCSAGTLWSVQF